LKISIVVIIAVALIYFIVGIFMHGDTQTKKNYQKFSQHMSSSAKKSTEGTDETDVALDGILINLGGGKYHYMKADMTFKMKNRDDKKSLEKNIHAIRDLVLRFTSFQKSSELITDAGKAKYKEKLKKLIYDNFGYDVEDIYFRSFVLAP
jgi:flagellar basal body-associated protein FliL